MAIEAYEEHTKLVSHFTRGNSVGARFWHLARNFMEQHGPEAWNEIVEKSLWREAGFKFNKETQIVPIDPPIVSSPINYLTKEIK